MKTNDETQLTVPSLTIPEICGWGLNLRIRTVNDRHDPTNRRVVRPNVNPRFVKRKPALAAVAGLVTLLIVCWFCFAEFGLWGLFERQPASKIGIVEWKDQGPTPLSEKGFVPQGLACVDGYLLLSNSWKDSRSRIYRIAPETMTIQASFDMPGEAVHTSGLAWDGAYLWAVDYSSNRCYKIDLSASFREERAKVIGSFDTTLRGSSACCFVYVNGQRLLAISDFMRTRRTILVRHEKAIENGTALDNIAFGYRNGGFSQGLESDGRYLYEAENKFGLDIINKLDIKALIENGDAKKATITQYRAPGRSIEDLAWDGQCLWTSDETSFRFYKGVLK